MPGMPHALVFAQGGLQGSIMAEILSQGILGVICALFVGLYLKELGEHKASRMAYHAELRDVLEKAAASEREITNRHAYQIRALNDEHQDELRELHAQTNALREAHAARERVALQTVEDFAKQSVGAVEELAKVGELLRRVYDRTRR